MSGITTIITRAGQYRCQPCLEKALERLGLQDNVELTTDGEVTSLIARKRVRDGNPVMEQQRLDEELQAIHKRILPVYTEAHAIHSLEEKGFKPIKTLNLADGHKIILEKIVGMGNNERIERFEISVFPGENKILVDGGNMPGNYCRQYTKKFQQSMGDFYSFVPHHADQGTAVKTSTKTLQHQKIGRE